MVVYCVNCGSENPEHAKYCYKCGKPIWKPTSTDNPPRHSINQHPTGNDPLFGKNCPYCQVPFKPGADAVSCPKCHMLHHWQCWAENGNKCTTFGCTGTMNRTLEQSSVTARDSVTPNVTEAPAEPSSGPRVRRTVSPFFPYGYLEDK